MAIEWQLDGIDEILLSDKDKIQNGLKDLEISFEYKGSK
ncbi:hypothetical protein LL033_14415 [Clostridium estertheticum]|nr:hypothetical protein [Clostridium estertheticum]WAG57971.1 hypothetical protein LL033_14415 [Clostridium estertheticum]